MLAALVGKFRLRVSVELTFENFSILIDDIPPKGPPVFSGNGYYHISVDSTGKNKDTALEPAGCTVGPELKQDAIWLKLEHRRYNGTLLYSLDGEHDEPLGDRDYPYRTEWYEGTKVGLFCYNLS